MQATNINEMLMLLNQIKALYNCMFAPAVTPPGSKFRKLLIEDAAFYPDFDMLQEDVI